MTSFLSVFISHVSKGIYQQFRWGKNDTTGDVNSHYISYVFADAQK